MSTEPDSPPVVSMEELRGDGPEEPVKASPKSLMDSLTESAEPARTGTSGKSSTDYGPTSAHASEAPQKPAKAARVGVLGWLAARENRKAAEARANQTKTVRTETVTESRVTGSQSLSKSDTKGSSNRQDANKSSRDTKRADTGSVRDHRNADDKSTKGHDTQRADTRADQSKSDRKKSDSSADKSSTDRKDTRGHDTKNHGGHTRADKSSSDRKDQSSTGRTRPESDKRNATRADLPSGKNLPVNRSASPRVPTQSSREAGYRDGQRVAKGAGHVQAYGDGTRDGWRAGRKDTEAQRRELDRRRDEPKKETENVTTPTDTAPKPVVVTGIDKDGVTLGDGARPSMTRGEVASLRAFHVWLEEQENFLIRKADVARQIAAAAAQLHHEAVQMQEAVRSVEGGEKLSGALGRLVESSQGRVTAAEELHTKATQGAEKAKTLRTNMDTRYMPIYQAVVDSDETTPAESKFYRDGGISRD